MDYHSLDVKEVFKELDSNPKGLSELEISERLSEYGRNILRKTKHFNAIKAFLDQFKSFLIIVLIFAAIVSFFMKSVVDSIIIFIIIFINAGIGFSQEYKAEKAIEALKKIMVPSAKVLRKGRVIKINSQEIVPGDILILDEGDKIMADARIFESNGFKVNEAVLTGESVADVKISGKLGDSVPLADRVNMVYQGTEVVAGSAKALVVSTGMNTELGKISELVQMVKPEKNPFKEKLDDFAKKLGIFILILSGIVIGLMVLFGGEFLQSLLVGVSLAVSAIPEGLPAVIALGLAFATRRMLKKNVLVRKLQASETLGRATVICTDKTGTLTEEEMKVSDIYVNGEMNSREGLDLLLKIGILCNKARLETDTKGKEYLIGDPTEKALIVSAKNNFLSKEKLTREYPKIKEFPFSSERKLMSIVRKNNEKSISYVKGAPERMIENSDYELINGRKLRLNDIRKFELTKVYEMMAKEGLRVLGFGYKELEVRDISQKDAERGLVFVGFQGMIDPPRKEVKQAIAVANQAGIKVIMITGDSELTANAVAKEIGLKGESISSEQLQKINDNELFNKIKNVSVFSRISPKDKLRIINVLKKRGEVVAMTGDGVNDALALKRSDIWIAMGIRGTDVARDASDIVLIDDNFASIVEGVKEGRRVYDNIKKFVKFLLSANFAQVVLVLLVILIWRNPELLPLLPLQILWINLVTDSLPALALSAESIEENVMERKPSKQGILKGITSFILIAGIIASLISFLFFYWDMADIDKARTMAVTSAIIFEMFLVFNCKSNSSVFKSPINKYLIYAVLISIGMHLIALYTPLNSLLYFVPLGFMDWLKIIGFSFAGFLIMEAYKVFKAKKIRKING